MRVRVTPAAYADLTAIKAYIAEELNNEDAAERTVARIVADSGRLAAFPMLGADLVNVVGIQTGFRFLVSGSYLVFYKVEQDSVALHRVIYGRRDYAQILFDMEPDTQE